MISCISRFVKIKEHLPFCREFSAFCIEHRVFGDCVVLEKRLLETQLFNRLIIGLNID